MSRPSRHRALAAALMGVMAAGLSVPSAGHYGRGERAPLAATSAAASAPLAQSRWHAGAASGVMRVGLVLVDAPSQAPPLPDPASLDFPATSRAIRCESDSQQYRECQTPFRGPVRLAREVSGTRCVEDQNWGWREGRVWVARGCSAVFVRIGET
ncbi:MAG: DUF3011 domain-containing protein [Thiobacillus sp.]